MKYFVFIAVVLLHVGAFYYFQVEGEKKSSHQVEAVVDSSELDSSVPVIKKAKKKKKLSLSSLGTNFSKVENRKDKKIKNNYLYCLPFKAGSTYKIGQTSHGTTHQGLMSFSIDFDMDIGQEVRAARGGIVYTVVDHFAGRGTTKDYLEKANHVIVNHEDGTYAMYSHLMNEGVKVSVGQQVKTGDLLGISGDTGYLDYPHLHFTVGFVNKNSQLESLPVSFLGEYGDVVHLAKNQDYSAFKGCIPKKI